MNISEAVEKMKQGKKVRNRSCWSNPHVHLFMKDNTVYSKEVCGDINVWDFTQADVLKGVWEVVMEDRLMFKDLNYYEEFKYGAGLYLKLPQHRDYNCYCLSGHRPTKLSYNDYVTRIKEEE